jgi:hypothetical protein
MTQSDTKPGSNNLPQGSAPEPAVHVAVHAQNMSEDGNPDPFPPEGTDDKLVQAGETGETALTDEEGLKAAQYVIATRLGLDKAGDTLGVLSPHDGRELHAERSPDDSAPTLDADAIARTVAAPPAQSMP